MLFRKASPVDGVEWLGAETGVETSVRLEREFEGFDRHSAQPTYQPRPAKLLLKRELSALQGDHGRAEGCLRQQTSDSACEESCNSAALLFNFRSRKSYGDHWWFVCLLYGYDRSHSRSSQVSNKSIAVARKPLNSLLLFLERIRPFVNSLP